MWGPRSNAQHNYSKSIMLTHCVSFSTWSQQQHYPRISNDKQAPKCYPDQAEEVTGLHSDKMPRFKYYFTGAQDRTCGPSKSEEQGLGHQNALKSQAACDVWEDMMRKTTITWSLLNICKQLLFLQLFLQFCSQGLSGCLPVPCLQLVFIVYLVGCFSFIHANVICYWVSKLLSISIKIVLLS